MSSHTSCWRSLGKQGQILWRGRIVDAPKLMTLSCSDTVPRPWSALEAPEVSDKAHLKSHDRERKQADAHLQTSDVASHDSGTCVITLTRRCVEMRSDLNFCATTQPSPSGHIWSGSANQTQLLKKRNLRCRGRFPCKDWRSLDKAPHKAAEESSVVTARTSQKQTV